MTFEHKPNRGSLFRNDKKEKDAHPDSKGSALIDGKEYWIAAWRNAEPGKTVYWSLSFQEKEGHQASAATEPDQSGKTAQDSDPLPEDRIPF